MFGRKKNKDKEPAKAKAVEQPSQTPYDIRVMPKKFRAAEPPKKSLGIIKWVGIGIVILIGIGGISYAAYYLATSQTQTDQVLPITPALDEERIMEPAQQPQEPQETEPQQPAEPTTGEEEEPQAPAEQQEPSQEPTTYTTSIDSDGDGLTNTEEALYQTEARIADTDGDGFNDGPELINGYSPRSAGVQLQNSGVVNIYQNTAYGYSVLHPSSWLAQPENASLSEVVFQSTTGEYISITAEENTGSFSLLEYYLNVYPDTDPASVQQRTTRSGLSVVSSGNGLVRLVADSQDPMNIFTVQYHPGRGRTVLNFETTFEMLIESMSF